MSCFVLNADSAEGSAERSERDVRGGLVAGGIGPERCAAPAPRPPGVCLPPPGLLPRRRAGAPSPETALILSRTGDTGTAGRNHTVSQPEIFLSTRYRGVDFTPTEGTGRKLNGILCDRNSLRRKNKMCCRYRGSFPTKTILLFRPQCQTMLLLLQV